MRRGFTLVELLTVIVIIAMLAGLSLGALYAARESARTAKTASTIHKLDTIVQAHFEEYASRRVPLDTATPGVNHGLRMPPPMIALARLQILRYIMKMEMPDHLSDVVFPRPAAAPDLHPAAVNHPHVVTVSCSMRHPVTKMMVTERWEFQVTRTAMARHIYLRCGTMSIPNDNDNAELLFLWVRTIPEALDRFQDSEIGDVDGDGFFEFIDGWGRPIKFLRWPTGFEGSSLMTGDADNDHCPLDARRVDAEAFRTVPLIWSNGRDGLSGIDLVDAPYEWDTVYSNDYGKPVDPTHAEFDRQHDNIHNHAG
jgi:prepilin-type N-terminal cleavage/methylation domain-containing protein